RSKRQNDGEFIENERRIFDEHGIGKCRFGRKRDDFRTKLLQQLFVGAMLGACTFQVNRAAFQERQFAIDDSWAYSASDCGQHRSGNFTGMLWRIEAEEFRE